MAARKVLVGFAVLARRRHKGVGSHCVLAVRLSGLQRWGRHERFQRAGKGGLPKAGHRWLQGRSLQLHGWVAAL